MTVDPSWLAGVTYRPGWRLSLPVDPFEGQQLRIVGAVENSYRPGQFVDLGITTFVPPLDDRAAFDRFLIWRLARVESHEAREWLQRDGVPIFDPHRSEQ